jgi:hypothetical protein
MLVRMQGKRNLYILFMGLYISVATMEISMEYLKIELLEHMCAHVGTTLRHIAEGILHTIAVLAHHVYNSTTRNSQVMESA